MPDSLKQTILRRGKNEKRNEPAPRVFSSFFNFFSSRLVGSSLFYPVLFSFSPTFLPHCCCFYVCFFFCYLVGDGREITSKKNKHDIKCATFQASLAFALTVVFLSRSYFYFTLLFLDSSEINNNGRQC